MKIATWNINSIKAHAEAAVAWLKDTNPDVVCLQEIKCEDQAFPAGLFEDLGYTVTTHGQKTYNGVAILSKLRPEEVRRGLPGDASDIQARYLEVAFVKDHASYRVACLYLPNGNPPGTDKFAYKMAWMDRLTAHARDLLKLEEVLVLAGDYNVIPTPLDARFPDLWRNDALFLPESRAKFRALCNLGFSDALRLRQPEAAGLYTFWDYQAGAWQKNNGIRIDHHLLSPQAADRLGEVRIDRHVRGWERPSDHVPVTIEIK